MECKKCGNEIKEGEEYCGFCGLRVKNNEPIKIKFKHWLIGIIILVLLIIGIFISFVFEKNPIKEMQSIIKGEPEWIENIGNEKVFNIDYNEFVEKCKTRLEELSTMTVRESQETEFIGGEINYPDGWLIVEKNENTYYAYGSLLYEEYMIGRMLKIEEYQGKVKNITFLESTNSLTGTIAEQVVIEVLESYGIYDENESEKFKQEVNMTTQKFEDALVSMGKYLDSSSSNDIVVNAYRRNGNFGYIPYEYDNRKIGNYVTITIK